MRPRDLRWVNDPPPSEQYADAFGTFKNGQRRVRSQVLKHDRVRSQVLKHGRTLFRILRPTEPDPCYRFSLVGSDNKLGRAAPRWEGPRAFDALELACFLAECEPWQDPQLTTGGNSP